MSSLEMVICLHRERNAGWTGTETFPVVITGVTLTFQQIPTKRPLQAMECAQGAQGPSLGELYLLTEQGPIGNREV